MMAVTPTGEMLLIRSRQESIYVEGIILDAKTSAVIPDVTICVVFPTGLLQAPTLVSEGYYQAWTEHDVNTTAVRFEKKGYKSQTVPFSELMQNPDIYLQEGSEFPYWMIVMVIAAVAIHKKKSGKVGAMGIDDLLPIFLLVGGVLAFSLIQKLLVSIGLWDSQDTKDLDNLQDDPNSFWNPNYWQTVKPANANYSYAITQATARQWAKDIWDAIGAINDCESCIIAVFKRCKTRANASFLAWEFQNVYNQDLLTWLRGGTWPSDRLSDADVNLINKYINNLPKY